MHVVVMPILLLNLIAVIHIAKAQWPKEPLFHIWLIVLAFVFLLMSLRLAGIKRPINRQTYGQPLAHCEPEQNRVEFDSLRRSRGGVSND
jgi:hypothetical protein